MTDIILRPYQQQFIDDVRNQFLQGYKRVVGVAPCGSGKTIMTGWMIKEAEHRGKKAVFFVHRQELIRQTSETFTRLDIPHGIISSEITINPELPVQIAGVQTLARRLDKIPPPDFLVCDECHHILANTYKKIVDKWSNAFLLGVTATPQRMGGLTLADSFDSMVESLSVNELIELGNLTPFKYFAPDIGVDLSNVKIQHGDFSNRDLEAVMIDKTITGNIVEHYLKLANDKSAICYCVNVEHSKTVADAFNRAGIPAAHVDGETRTVIREQLVEAFREGDIKVLCNAELFSEGFDVPGCQAVILARPTHSLTLYIQQSMRAMRPDRNDPDKTAIIIDHVRNYARHGLPNTPHAWSLLPNIKKRTQCPCCKKMIIPVTNPKTKRTFCPKCNFEFIRKQGNTSPRRIVETSDGSLKEIVINYDTTPTETRIQKKPATLEELSLIARQKKYKPAWVAYRALEMAASYDDCLRIAEFCGYRPGWAYHHWQDLKAELLHSDKLQNSRSLC